MMKGIYAVSLLIVSNIFMTFAWYGHVDAVESNSRGDYTDCVYCVFHLIV